MVTTGADILTYVRYLIRDYTTQYRVGVIYDDREILRVFGTLQKESAVEFVRRGLFHHITGFFRQYGFVYDETDPPLPVDLFYGVALSIGDVSIPVYNGGRLAWGDQWLVDTNRPHAIIDTSVGTLDIHFPSGGGPIGAESMLLYLSTAPVVFQPSDVSWGCSRTFFYYVADRTVLELLRKDAGAVQDIERGAVAGMAMESIVVSMLRSATPIMMSNGILKPSVEGLVR